MGTSFGRFADIPITPLITSRRSQPASACPSGSIRGLLFAIGNVLYDDTVWRRWVTQLLARLGLHADYREFFRIWDQDYVSDVHCGRRKFCEAFEAFLLSRGLSPGQIDELQMACQGRRRHLQTSIRPLPGVRNTLACLHRSGFVLGAVGNADEPSSVLGQQVEHLAGEGLFATIISSIDLKHAMPEPACYLAASQAMKLPAEQVTFVGHGQAELAGAAAVGMRTMAFNCESDVRAETYLRRFEDLLEAVQPETLATAG
jgi:FMN phosphatase YigB (HAD superfamily)